MPYSDESKNKSCKLKSYYDNKILWQERQRIARNKTRDYIVGIKSKSKCAKCDENHIATLDFHHKDPKEKEIAAHTMIRNKYSIDRIDRELAKCEVLCSNCHRKVHYDWQMLGLID